VLTRKQQELLLYIDKRLKEDGVSPSFEEMKEALNLKSKSGIHRLIKALEERGFLNRLANRARALDVVRLPGAQAAKPTLVHDQDQLIAQAGDKVVRGSFGQSRRAPEPKRAEASEFEIPLHGRIAAGGPIEALENVDSMLVVPPSMLGSGDHFALEVDGDSMIEAGIYDGDYVIIQKSEKARDGDIVVALVDNQDATLKTLRTDGPRVKLEPANASYKTQVYDAGRVRIQGRLKGLIRRY
jgi:repressor LexA